MTNQGYTGYCADVQYQQETGVKISQAMIRAGVEAIYESDWEFNGDAEALAAAIYAAMESLRL